MKYLKLAGEVMTSSMEDHKARGTSGEDFVRTGGCTSTTKMIKPCSDFKLIGSRSFSDGTYKEFYQGSMNGYKFSMYTCHCHDFVTTGDDYSGSTGYHLHQLYFHGHQTIDYMQNNRNTKGVKQSEIDAKCVPQNTGYGSVNNAYQIIWNSHGVNYTRYLPESRGHHVDSEFKNATLEITVDMETCLYIDEEFKNEDKNFKVKKGDKLIGIFLN